MTLQQFREYNEMEQLSAILEFGCLLAQHAEADRRIFLYRLDGFYVTTHYDAQNDLLTDIFCFLEVEQEVPHFRKHLISVNPAERNYSTPEM